LLRPEPPPDELEDLPGGHVGLVGLREPGDVAHHVLDAALATIVENEVKGRVQKHGAARAQREADALLRVREAFKLAQRLHPRRPCLGHKLWVALVEFLEPLAQLLAGWTPPASSMGCLEGNINVKSVAEI
jgi:hypothetical protein